jgi:AcrR family transcriptional regulator
MTEGSRRTRRSGRHARQIVADYRRQTILNAARAVFARHGFARTTMELVAREADAAKGTLYLYYRSKTALYSAAVISGLEDLARETVQVVGSGQPLREVLLQFFEMRQSYFEEHSDFFRIYGAEFASHVRAAAQIQREFARLHEQQVEALEQAITSAVQTGQVRTVDPRAVALAIFDLSHGGIVRRIRLGGLERTLEVKSIVDMLWKGLSPR